MYNTDDGVGAGDLTGATAAEKFERIVEVGGRFRPPTSTIRSNFSAAVAPNIASTHK